MLVGNSCCTSGRKICKMQLSLYVFKQLSIASEEEMAFQLSSVAEEPPHFCVLYTQTLRALIFCRLIPQSFFVSVDPSAYLAVQFLMCRKVAK